MKVEDFLFNSDIGFRDQIRWMSYAVDTSKALSSFIEIDVSSDIVEVPRCLLHTVAGYIGKHLDTLGITIGAKYVDCLSKRTFSSALTTFGSGYKRASLVKIAFPSKDTYYGGPGIIFDADMNMLLSSNFLIEKNPDNNKLVIKRGVCRISPSVFVNKNKPIEKGIIKNVIPVCVSHSNSNSFLGISNTSALELSDEFLNSPIILIIGENEKMKVLHPSIQGNFDNMDLEINKFLRDNVENIFL